MSALAAFVLRLASGAAYSADVAPEQWGDAYEAWVLLSWAADAYEVPHAA